METIPALLINGLFPTAMKSTPDDPVMFEMYWKDQDVHNYDYLLIRYNKPKILRYLLDNNAIHIRRLHLLCVWNDQLPGLTILHVLDKYPEICKGEPQKAFCKVRLHCRKIALAVLCVGKLKKDYRDISAIIARGVWGARGYCKIIKIKRFRI